ncbi:guanine nucleotide exchange factor DBS-like isoform X2 [Corticium candelabrum]|uniref:guanine nucleotide exchange factor DBS-like isoform X2 n=1 Tax=Corticium candelabrum TaxID=121492 RepID=UPI002E25E5C2|nr:guanine nucleotide exchange factor DBS-like isoform X2 [Corticium candelabrum]
MFRKAKRKREWIKRPDDETISNGLATVDEQRQVGDADMTDWLLSGVAILTGGRDHDHRPIIECQARVLDEKVISDESMKGGLYYLMTVPEEEDQLQGFLCILDGRDATDFAVSRFLKVLLQVYKNGVKRIFRIVVLASEERAQLQDFIIQLQLDDEILAPLCQGFNVSFLQRFVGKAQLTEQLDGSLCFDCELWVKAKSAVDSYVNNCHSFAQQLEAMLNLWRHLPTDSVHDQARELLNRVDGFLEHGRLITDRQANPSGNWSMLSWSPEYQVWMQHISELCEHLVTLKSSAQLPSFAKPEVDVATGEVNKLKEENTIDSALAFMDLAEEEYLDSSSGQDLHRRTSLESELEALQTTARDVCNEARHSASNILMSAFTSRNAKEKSVRLQERIDSFLTRIQEKKDQLVVEQRVNSLIDKAIYWSVKSRKMMTLHRADSSARSLELGHMVKDCQKVYRSSRRPTMDDRLALQTLAKKVKDKDPGAFTLAQEAIVASEEADQLLEDHMQHLKALQHGEYNVEVPELVSFQDAINGSSFDSIDNDYQSIPDVGRLEDEMDVPAGECTTAESANETKTNLPVLDFGNPQVMEITTDITSPGSIDQNSSYYSCEQSVYNCMSSSHSEGGYGTVQTVENQDSATTCTTTETESKAVETTTSNPISAVLPEKRKSVRNDLHIMLELVNTEEKYVSDLQHVCKHYLTAYRNSSNLPFCLKGRENELFGNIEKLLVFHRDTLLPKLQAIVECPWMVGMCLTNYVDEFGLYSLYFKHTKRREELLEITSTKDFFNAYRSQLGDMMSIQDYLSRPFQRLTRYRQLLEGLSRFKYSGPEWSEDANHALGLALRQIKFQLRHGNDLQVLELLRDFPGSLMEQGNLLLQVLLLLEQKRKHFRRLFLFEDMIMFTKEQFDAGLTVFKFKDGWKTTELGLTANVRCYPRTFLIWFRKQTAKTTITLEAATEEIKMEWVQEVNYLLYEQALKFRERYGQVVVYSGVRSHSLFGGGRPMSTLSMISSSMTRVKNVTTM